MFNHELSRCKPQVERPSVGPKRRRSPWPAAFGRGLILLLAGWGIWSCTSAPPPKQEAPAPSAALQNVIELAPEAIQLADIQFAEAVKAGLPETLEVPGRVGVNENRTARVGALVDGRITRVHSNVGDRVRQGQVLAEIQSYEVDDTRAQYAKARAELERANSQLEFSQKLRDRAERLYQLKAGSLDELQRAEVDLHRAQSEIVVIRAEMGRLEEKLEQLGLSVEGALEEYAETRGGEADHFNSRTGPNLLAADRHRTPSNGDPRHRGEPFRRRLRGERSVHAVGPGGGSRGLFVLAQRRSERTGQSRGLPGHALPRSSCPCR